MTAHTARLLARLGERGVVLAADPELDPLLEALFDRAEGRLPHRPIGRDAVVDRVADALLASDDTPDREALTRLHAADLYLALGLAAKDRRALEIAEAELFPAVRQAAARIDARPAFVDLVARRVRDRLFVGGGSTPAALAQYRGTGPLSRWARVLASRIALDLQHADDGCEGALAASGDAELEAIWRTCGEAYKAAFAEVFATLSRRERNLLRQRHADDLDLDVIGRIYRVKPAIASGWLKQLEERLVAATCTALVAKLAIGEAQVHGIEALVAGKLPLSVARMFGRGRGGGGGGEGGDSEGGDDEGGDSGRAR